MSSNTILANNKSGTKLIASGKMTRTFDFAMSPTTFYEIGTYDLGTQNVDRIRVQVYGRYVFGTQDFIAQPFDTSWLGINIAGGHESFDGAFTIINGVITFGIIQNELTTQTPIAPYSTASILYYIFEL